MKILFITSSGCDNLEDGMLHGFRSLLGADCVEYPKKEVMYQGYTARAPERAYGKLFTVWRTLPDIPVDRMDIEDRVRNNEFDLIVFGSIWRTQALYVSLQKWLTPKNTMVFDGEDHIPIWRDAAHKFVYFKRELVPKISYYYWYKLIPKSLYTKRLLVPKTIQPISFAIPKEKITYGITRESKLTLLPRHIVDKEVLEHPAFHQKKDEHTDHVFHQEQQYYQNLQQAKFGITTKRGGWDCLRHYEIAANGAVQCFRSLETKSQLCAPHELINGINCLSYSNADNLAEKIDKLSNAEYDAILAGSYEWINRQTTEFRAEDVLRRFYDSI